MTPNVAIGWAIGVRLLGGRAQSWASANYQSSYGNGPEIFLWSKVARS